MKNEYLKIGFITGTHGLRGGCKVIPTTDFIEDRFFVGAKVSVYNAHTKDRDTLTISSISSYKNVLTIVFEELASIDTVEMYLKQAILIPREKDTLPADHFYLDDLIGLNIILEDGTNVGVVSGILEYASYHTLRVKREGAPDLLIPYIDEFIVSTDLKTKQIVFKPLTGML